MVKPLAVFLFPANAIATTEAQRKRRLHRETEIKQSKFLTQ
jgi:hypothetical protein